MTLCTPHPYRPAIVNGSTMPLEMLLKNPGDHFFYDYRLDAVGWRHEVTLLELVDSASVSVVIPQCVDGSGQAPPEDCGGGTGYSDILALLGQAREFDPNTIDLTGINFELRQTFKEVTE